ncbi:MAG: ribonuclease E inhibitor RraB [Eubacteriales bacterium]|nr:ribonuclease E inhibitor RraB [Eubacteriales bacterium]
MGESLIKFSIWLGIVYFIMLVIVSFNMVFYIIRYLCRRKYFYTDLYKRGDKLIGVPLSSYMLVNGCLVSVKITFDVFNKCDEYYLYKKAADLYHYCMIKGWFFAGFEAETGTTATTYYIYIPEKGRDKHEKTLKKYFSKWRHRELAFEASKSLGCKKYKSLLPDHRELARMYNDLLLRCLNIDFNKEKTVCYYVSFNDKKSAEAFSEHIRQNNLTAEIHGIDIDGPYWQERDDYYVEVYENLIITLERINYSVDRLMDAVSRYGGDYLFWVIYKPDYE